MKKLAALLLALTMMVFAVSCGQKAETGTTDSDQEKTTDASKVPEASDKKKPEDLKVSLILANSLGDMSFSDSAASGIQMMKDELGIVHATIFECNDDVSKLEPALLDAIDAKNDIIIMTFDFAEYIEKYADEYPEIVFMTFDDEIDYSKGDFKNVHCVTYKNNEAAFLGGFLAAELTKSGEPYNDKKIISFLGGMDQPVVNDFLVGYIDGAQYVDPETKVAVTYTNSWSDSAKGKELSISMINQGADIGFNVAGGAGTGLIEASYDAGTFVIGVDADQAMAFKDSRPEFSNIIPTSILKNIGFSLKQAVGQYIDGTLPLGETSVLGISEGGVGIADNEFYQKLVPEDIRSKLTEVEKKVVAGEIEITTALGMSPDEINTIRNSVKP